MSNTTGQTPGIANTTIGAAIQRYKIGYHADEWGQRSSTPSGIPDASGSWVRYADHVNALAAGQATAAQGDAIEHELAMLIRRIVSSARRNCQDESNVLKLANEAWAYLVRKGLVGSPLRDAGIESDVAPQAADSVLEDAAREAIEKVLALFPFNVPTQKFTVNNGPCLTADNDDEFYSVKRVLAFLTEIKTTLDAARKQGASHDR